jgi:hypothetical protein
MKRIKSEIQYTDLPGELHRKTLYDWGRRGLRTYNGLKVRGAKGRPRCSFDPAWTNQFERIPARSGNQQLLRMVSAQTTEWIAVARRRGQFWPVVYYLVPRAVASIARQAIEQQSESNGSIAGVPF